MGGESLSQEQIDALFRNLAGGNNKAPDPKPETDADNADSKESADDGK